MAELEKQKIQTTEQQYLDYDDDSETIEVDMEEFFKNEEMLQSKSIEINSQNPKVTTDTAREKLPSLPNVLGTSSSLNANNLNIINRSIELQNSFDKESDTIFPTKSRYHSDNHYNRNQLNQCPISLPNSSTTRNSFKITSSLNNSMKRSSNNPFDNDNHIHRNSRESTDCSSPNEFYPSEIKTRSMKQTKQSNQMKTSKSINESNFIIDSQNSEEKTPKKQFKTERKRLLYLREKKIYGRNEESEIINGLQYLLVMNHDASFDYLKEKKSKKTIKFRMPHNLTFRGMKYSSNLIAEMGEQWLIDLGLCMKCDEKVVTAKRIQRSKEAEVNGGLICILHSLGYEFRFKKLKDKSDRKTTPFVKISEFKYPNETQFRNVEELKKLGRKYNDIILMNEDQLINQN